MAVVNNIGPAMRGAGAGLSNFRLMMEDQAAINQLLANSQYISEQQNMPMADMAIPQAGGQPVTVPGLTTPQINPSQAGILPAGAGYWAPWENLPAAPAVPPEAVAPGVTDWSPKLPWKPQTPAAPQPWGRAIPAIMPNQGPLPVDGQAPITAGANTIQNLIYNSPYNLMAGLHNVFGRPILNGAQALMTPPTPAAKPVETTGQPAPAGATVPTPAGPPSTQQAGLAPSASQETTVAPGVAASSSLPATPVTSDGTVPRDVRDEALRLSPDEHNYYQEMLLQQREQIAADVNNQIAFYEQQKQQLAQVQQAKLSRLQADAAAAQRTGNIGLMKKLQGEAETILLDATTGLQNFDTQAQALRQAATQAFRQNEQDMWRQQAFQAEAEFINAGDPSRMLSIFDAYGFPVQLQDAGNGNYFVIDITANGKGRRRGGKAYSPEQIGDMFHSMISDEFRQSKAAQAAEQAKSMQDHLFELDKIDAQAAADIKKKMADNLTSPKKYLQQTLDDGSIIYAPEDGSGNAIVYNPNPPEIPNSGGLLEPKVKLVPTGQ